MGFVLLAPWFIEAFAAFLEVLRHWWVEQRAPVVVAQASFLLIVGGLLMLSVVVGTAVLRSLLPIGTPVEGPVRERVARRLLRVPDLPIPPTQVERGRTESRPSLEGFNAGRTLAQKWKPETLDEALTVVAKEAIAAPRLLRLFADSVQVRHYDCRACEPGRGGEEGCSRSIGFYETAFSLAHGRKAEAKEIACHRRGDRACEFEVRW